MKNALLTLFCLFLSMFAFGPCRATGAGFQDFYVTGTGAIFLLENPTSSNLAPSLQENSGTADLVSSPTQSPLQTLLENNNIQSPFQEVGTANRKVQLGNLNLFGRFRSRVSRCRGGNCN